MICSSLSTESNKVEPPNNRQEPASVIVRTREMSAERRYQMFGGECCIEVSVDSRSTESYYIKNNAIFAYPGAPLPLISPSFCKTVMRRRNTGMLALL